MTKAASVKFDLGRVVVTTRAAELLDQFGESADSLLARHQSGDWGSISEQQRQINEEALSSALSVVSTFNTPGGQALQIFTAADRSSTVIHVA